ncbi:hypothetical protein [Thalassovita sp.]|uniref:hypothetical protein n=1 Tax=Thalassovita sp. TaxID=1979401 RepID=UPI0029DE7921|nr:hypothetical protein [Thalassovita sp.]
MKQLLTPIAVLCLCAAPALAEEPSEDQGLSLMEEGAKLFFRGIMQEMEPAMEDLKALADTMEPAVRQFIREMGPALAEVLGKIDDLSMYHPPEMLPNGDIIMRRKPPAEVQAEPENPEIDL